MKQHTYFISYTIPNMDNDSSKLGFGNAIFSTASRGKQLVSDAINIATKSDPNAIVLNIVKLD